MLPGAPGPERYQDTLEKAGSLINDIRLEHAKGLAWKGRPGEALNLLKGILAGEGADPGALDLQARIFAQQGRLSEAETAWRAALEADPNNPIYLAGLARIARVRSRAYNWKPLLNLISWRLLILLFIGGSLFWISRIQTIAYRNNAGINALQNQNQALLDSLALLKAALPEAPPGPAAGGPPGLALQSEGVSVQKEGDRLFLLFEEGLFQEGVVFRPHAPELLSQLARQLELYRDSISLTIFGLADRVQVSPSSPYRDNNELGRARALKVYDYLRQHSNLPWHRVLIGSLGGSAYPFPREGDGDTGQPKNRSVVIQVQRQ